MKGELIKAAISEKTIFGFSIADLRGIIIMVIPFVISIRFNAVIPGKKFLFFQTTKSETYNIRPALISMILSAVFYASLVVRYEGIFRTKNLFDITVSIIRMFLNCWVIAAFISLVIPSKIPTDTSTFSVLFSSPETTMLVLAIFLSWLGMKTIAGYSWLFFIIAAWKRLLALNGLMEMGGAVFILSFAISLLLQIKDYTYIRNFMNEFRNKAAQTETIRAEINAAINDGSMKLQRADSYIESLDDHNKQTDYTFLDVKNNRE